MITGPAEWLLTFRSVRQELKNPSMGNRETRGGWLVREAVLQSLTPALANTALEQLVERGVLTPVRYAPVAGPLAVPDPGTGCATTWPPLPAAESHGWQGRRSPAWAWVYRVHALAAREWFLRALKLPTWWCDWLPEPGMVLEVYRCTWEAYTWSWARMHFLGVARPRLPA